MSEGNKYIYNQHLSVDALPTIGQAKHREMWGKAGVSFDLLRPLEKHGYSPPLGGDFLDIGTGLGATPKELARKLREKYRGSKFIGVDVLAIPIDPDFPESGESVKLIGNTDGFLYLATLPDESLSLVTIINLSEALGTDGSANTLSTPNNIGFLGQELLRTLKENGIVFISGGLSEAEVSLFSSFPNEGKKIVVLPVGASNHGRLKNRFFQKKVA